MSGEIISLLALIKLKNGWLYDKSFNQAIVSNTFFLITILKAPLIDCLLKMNNVSDRALETIKIILSK